jgi:hypothetical protein
MGLSPRTRVCCLAEFANPCRRTCSLNVSVWSTPSQVVSYGVVSSYVCGIPKTKVLCHCLAATKGLQQKRRRTDGIITTQYASGCRLPRGPPCIFCYTSGEQQMDLYVQAAMRTRSESTLGSRELPQFYGFTARRTGTGWDQLYGCMRFLRRDFGKQRGGENTRRRRRSECEGGQGVDINQSVRCRKGRKTQTLYGCCGVFFDCMCCVASRGYRTFCEFCDIL